MNSTPGIPPKYIGRITITSGTNDTIHWYEEDSAAHSYSLSCTLSPGSYYPDALATEIQTQMDAESDANGLGQDYAGAGANYTVSFAADTGIPTISMDHPSAPDPQFYLKLTTTETQKALTGGDAAAGSRGRHHVGWNVDGSYPTKASTMAGDTGHANSWWPSEPRQGPSGDDEGQPTSTAGQFISNGGDVRTYDFSGDSADLDVRTVGYEWLLDADRTQYRDEFWTPYAKAGERFRFYEDRTSSSYVEQVLTGQSIPNAPFARMKNQGWWSFSHTMRNYTS